MRQGKVFLRITGNKRYFIGVGIGIICMIIVIAAWRMTSYASGDDVVFTIDHVEVTKDEFELFLQNNKALTSSYFKRKYNAEYTEDFWTSTYDGENPLDYAKQKAMEELRKYKMQQILMREQGIVSDISYDAFLKQFETENEQREAKVRNGQPIYGPKQYGASEYYSYVQNMNVQRWMDQLTKETLKSESEEMFRSTYEDMKREQFHRGYSYEYEKISVPSATEAQSELEALKQQASTNDLSTEQVVKRLNLTQDIHIERLSLDLDDKSKDDDLAQNLNLVLTEMKPGEFTALDSSGEDTVLYRLLAAKDKGYEPYEKVRAAVVQRFVQKQVELQVSQRLSKAVIEVHQEVLNRISFT
ncbi:peptidyl-prolyl cis-trans isomerase [Paenibacillus terrigena]|uniref:peptidyl-prolyl cis-trans isomerase n=1 Tax=Paenibacillus terrigena TaxID=369333 RepID=UPI0003769599|nr:peptidyl-prolyl cis-trans isomerase [Paenibacillus terrigena]